MVRGGGACSNGVAMTIISARISTVRLLVPLLALVTACGGSSDPSTDAAPVGSDVSSSEATSEATADAQEAADPNELLASAIDGLGSTYGFRSEVTLDGERASLAVGRRVLDGLEARLEQQSTTVWYRSIAGRRWVQKPDGTWDRLTDNPGLVDPIAQLKSPSAVRLVAVDGSTVTLDATYPASVFGLPQSDDLVVTLTVLDDVLSSVEYSSEFEGKAVELHSEFTLDVDGTPIVEP